MGMFNSEDVAAANDDPFNLPEGRHVTSITKSGPKSFKGSDGTEYNTWAIVFHCEDPDQDQEVLFFLGGDSKQQARTNSNIKKMLSALEIPEDEWDDISEDPEKLVGFENVVIERKAGKKAGQVFTNIIGLASDDDYQVHDSAVSAREEVGANSSGSNPWA